MFGKKKDIYFIGIHIQIEKNLFPRSQFLRFQDY